MSFRRFIEAEPYQITVEEVGPLFEMVVGQYQPGFKKYRVSFHAPKNQRQWKSGDFAEDVVYVISDSPHAAKRMAQDWIAARLDPREEHEIPRRVPKTNYLRSTERRHFDMKSRVVGSFRQVAEMLGYAAERRENAVDFIDEPELEILVDALGGRYKTRYMNSLSEPERRGLRQMLLATKRQPQLWGDTHGPKAAGLAKELTVKLWSRRDKPQADDTPDFGDFSVPTATPVPSYYSPTPYRKSVYRKKLTKRDVDATLARVNTYADVIREINRLGIPKAELDGVVDQRYGHLDREYEEKKMVYADLYKRLRIPSSHRVFGDDHVSTYFQKRGFDWEGYATEVLPTFGLETIRNNPEWEAGYEQNAEYSDWAVNWLWELYKAGPPRKEGTAASRYKEALEEFLNAHIEEKKMGRTQPAYEPLGEIPY